MPLQNGLIWSTAARKKWYTNALLHFSCPVLDEFTIWITWFVFWQLADERTERNCRKEADEWDWTAKFGGLSLLSVSLGKQLGVTGKVWYVLVDKALHWPWEESRECNSPRELLEKCDVVCSPLHSSYWLPTWAMVWTLRQSTRQTKK